MAFSKIWTGLRNQNKNYDKIDIDEKFALYLRDMIESVMTQ